MFNRYKTVPINNFKEIVCTESAENIVHEICLKKKILKPSHFMKKRQENTCQWLESQRMKIEFNCCSLNLKQSIFLPFPKKLVFKNFIPNSTSCLPLTLKNVDTISRCLRVVMEESPYFKLVHPVESEKIGAGLSATYKVLFTPGENKDYEHCIAYYCEGREFRIKIRAVGPHAIMDFPDKIEFLLCPVKHSSSKTVFVKNVGTCATCFTLIAKSPFSVNPKSGSLDMNENIQITIHFHPMFIGNYCDFLTLKYETGEEVHIKLFGVSDDVAVRLERSVLKMDNTYINMMITKNVLLLNRSNIVASFRWSIFYTQQEEEMNQTMITNNLELLKPGITVSFKDLALNHSNISDENKLFHGKNLLVDPVEGHIWPNSSLAMKISFSPSEPGEWKKVIYCDVEGRESRLPLNVEGFAFGPTLELSCTSLDIGSVLVGTRNHYEVVLYNKGPISANFCVAQDLSDLVSCFEITPMKGSLEEGCSIKFQISLIRDVLGPFVHIVLIRINDSSEPMTLSISGSIHAPSFNFDVDQLDFESISLGFDKTKNFKITNMSIKSFEFKVHIAKDEHEKVTPSNDTNAFEVDPSCGELNPRSSVEVTVRFRPKKLQPHHCYVIFNITNIKNSSFLLPIRARCIMPIVKVLTPFLNYNSIPLNFPVTKNIQLQNDSTVAGKYLVTKMETNLLICYSSSDEGVIEPNSSCSVPLIIIAKTSEEVQDSVTIYIRGSPVPLEVKVKCKGEGPVVTLSHEYLNWGNIPVLTNISKSITILNHSPIPALFKIRMLKKNSVWKVNPAEGVISSEGKIFLDLTANLNDSLNFTNHLEVTIEHSTVLSCQIEAQGKGSTIVLDPGLTDTILLGPQLSHSSIKRSYEISNCGRRIQSVTFKISQQQQDTGTSCDPSLKILPSRLELLPGKKSEITVMCSSNIACHSERSVLCQATIASGSSKEVVREFTVLCHFVEPVVRLSKSLMKFEVFKKCDDKANSMQSQSFNMMNRSVVTLGVLLRVERPFYISLPEGESIYTQLDFDMTPEYSQDVLIWFDPNFDQTLQSQCVSKCVTISFQNHPHKDFLTLQGNLYYSNLTFDEFAVDFGCILNYSEALKCLRIFNPGPLPVTYSWSFDKDATKLCSDVPQTLVNQNEQVEQPHALDFMNSISPARVLVIENKPFKKQRKLLPLNAAPDKVDKSSESKSTDQKCELKKNKFGEMGGYHPDKLKTRSSEQINFPKKFCSVQDISSKLIDFLSNLGQSSSVEEAFHIEPMFGSLQVGESETVTFVYHGYPYLKCSTKAICKVYGGPSYEVSVSGESSHVSYEFNTHTINFGNVHFNKVSKGMVQLANTGKVAFKFKVIVNELKGQGPNIFPSTGSVGMDCTQIFLVDFCPKSSFDFQYKFEIQVAHFCPETFQIKGNAVFPRVILDLPLNDDESLIHVKYSNWTERAKEIVKCKCTPQESLCDEIQLEAERLMFSDHLDSLPSKRELISNDQYKADFFLQDYLVDFGPLTLATVASKVVTVLNPGSFDVSFYVNDKAKRNLSMHGIMINLARIRCLPQNSTTNFEIIIDPINSTFDVGFNRAEFSIHVNDGPDIKISVRYNKIMPRLSLNDSHINFGEVLCGECKFIMIQFFNEKEIECCWSLGDSDVKEQYKCSRESSNKSLYPIFDLLPSQGRVDPGCTVNVQVKFTPRGEKNYQKQLMLVFEGSSTRCSIICKGSGVEREIEIIEQELEFGPILPNSEGCMRTLNIRNPSCIPVEMYCLEMDEVYLQEEKVLRLVDGYDGLKNLLLPPHQPGEGLPQEILKHCAELLQSYHEFKQENYNNHSDNCNNHSDNCNNHNNNTDDCANHGSLIDELKNVSEADLKKFQQEYLQEKVDNFISESPVTKALARCANIKLTDEEDGIVIIVHGAPKSGKSSLSACLATDYKVPVLNVDDVLITAMENRSTISGFVAYEICHREVKFEGELSHEGSRSSTPRRNGYKDDAKHKHDKNKDLESGKSISLKNGTKLLFTHLPEDVMVTIIKERLKHLDCLKGVLFDGLHSVFTENCRQTALCILKAIGKRTFIYAISLKLSYKSVKQKQIEDSNYLDNQLKIQEAKTSSHLNEMSEDEFDNLSYNDQIEFNRRRRDFKRSLLERKKTVAEKTISQEDVKVVTDKQSKKDRKKVRVKGDKMSKKKKQKTASHDSDDSSQYGSDASRTSASSKHADHLITEERYVLFENEFSGICSLFEFWDQSSWSVKGSPVEDVEQSRKVKKQAGTKDKKEKALKSDSHEDKVEESSLVKDLVVNNGPGIPHLIVNVSYQEPQSPYYKIMQSNVLPPPQQVLESLGLKRNESDVLPPITFSIVPYPVERSHASNKDIDHFQFIDSLPSIRSISDSKEVVEEVSSLLVSSNNQFNFDENIDEFYKSFYSKLKKRRWILPALSETALKIKFVASESIKASTSLNFRLVGRDINYQVPLFGFCGFPMISKEPKLVFPECIKSPELNDIIIKKYILSKEIFDFGPLLMGKSKEKYQEIIYPENAECLNIVNISPFEIEVNFAFLNDENQETFLFHPPVMCLYPNETRVLNIWAYPKTSGNFEDSLICCIRNNPEPVVFKITCQGVTPEVEVDTQLDFGGILLHKYESKTLTLRNKNILPAAWKLLGLEDLGKEFSISQEEGIIPPLVDQDIWFQFKAINPSSIKKTVRLEVYDTDNIIGLIKVEDIIITAEAYDLALDIVFPKGSSGGLDFGLNKVGEEVRQVCTLRNKGKYNISFKFELNTEKKYKAINKFVTVDPISGLLLPDDKPATVQISFYPKEETSVVDSSVLKCLVIDSKTSDDIQNYIASIPIKISASSTWMKFKIIPSQCLNFGSIEVGERKTMQVVIQNVGDKFDLKFYILQKDQPLQIQKGSSSTSSKESKTSKLKSKSALKKRSSDKKTKHDKKDAIKNHEKLELGNFVIHPSIGSVEAHCHVTVNVECFSDTPGKFDQMIAFNIPGIETEVGDEIKGSPYTLMSEFCLPRIEFYNESLIFEEHFIERNLTPQCFNFAKHLKGVGFYKQYEKRFVYNNLIIGTTSCARFRIINIEKIPCNVTFTVKSVAEFEAEKDYDESAFLISPTSCKIPPLESFYVDVAFSPSSVKAYLSKFEVVVDNIKESLTFEMFGEGVLPQIKILKPIQTDEFNNHVLNFQRVQVNEEKILPIIIMNDGTLDCNVKAQLIDPEKSFSMFFGGGIVSKDDLTFSLAAGEMFNFLVSFVSREPQKYEGELKLRIFGNEYDENLIQLVAESSKEIVCLQIPPDGIEPQNKSLEIETSDILNFGECGIKESRTLTFEMINNQDPCRDFHLKFEWHPNHEALAFIPRKGHLRAGTRKDIHVTFRSSFPVEISKHVACNLIPIAYSNECQLDDWDDGVKVVKWMGMPADDKRLPGQECLPKTKLKTTETKPEPPHDEIGDSLMLSLFIAANSQYCQYNMSSKVFIFKDTPLLQSRTYSLKITNSGKGQLKFKWDSLLTDTIQCGSLSSQQNINSPFSISPVFGSIPPGEFLDFSVTFFPKNVDEFSSKFVCNIQNLEPGFVNPELEVRGRCTLPNYYFELEHSEYLNERNQAFLSPDFSLSRAGMFENFAHDRLLNIVEFHAVGMCKSVLKRFHVVNPTSYSYFYEWMSFDPKEVRTPQFVCHKPSDSVFPGKKSEVTFAFTPNNVGVVESMWKFCIPDMNLVSKFLFVGKTRTPNIFFDRSHHNFGPVMIANKCQNAVILKNHEDEEFLFMVDPNSCINADRNEIIYIKPSKGVLPPRSNNEISFEYTATSEGGANFNVKFHIDRMLAPLNVNIKAQAYSMGAKVSYSKQSESHVALRSEYPEEIDFGQVYLYDSSVISILIENLGFLGFDFTWKDKNLNKIEADMDTNLSSVIIEPTSGYIRQGEKANCNLIFRPTKRKTLKNFVLILSINQSENYFISLKGSTKSTMLKFSKLCFNFGGRLIYELGHEVPSEELIITNQTDKPASINCLEHPDSWLSFSFEPKTIDPCKSFTVKFKFYAREVSKYQRVLSFIINESVTREIQIYGEGIQMKLEVQNSIDTVVHFGPVCIGQCVRRVVPVCNGCSVPLEFSLKIKPIEKELLAPGTLLLQPTGPLVIAARSCFNVEIFFSPKKRITRFTECVTAEGDYFKKTLFVVDGSAQGYKLALNSERLHFGICVLGSESTQSFILSNVGDIGSKFIWESHMLLPDFTINPLEGFIPPTSEVHFQVTFCPKEIKDELCCKMRCLTDYDYTPQLFLCGSCALPPPANETINMQATVRKQDKKTVEIINPTEHIWNVKPVISGEYFYGIEVINVPPKSSKNYKITYHPMVMTGKNKHKGSLFLPLPNEAGIMYDLLGTSDHPEAEDEIIRNIPSKVYYTESLRVQNWLNSAQRFKVNFQNLFTNKEVKDKFANKIDGTCVLSGVDFIEIPALSTKDYKLSVFSHKEGSRQFKAVFKNVRSKEYVFYKLVFNFTKPDAICCICLESIVRQKMQHKIILQNPLKIPATILSSCNVEDINILQNTIIPGLMEKTFTVEYFPLKPGKIRGRLELNSEEIGSFIYDLDLRAIEGPPERTLNFQTFIGSKQSVIAKFMNLAKTKTEYSCQIDHMDFICNKTVLAQSQGELPIEITYEPSKIGTVNSSMTISSPQGGNYTFPLVAECTLPKPQGPFLVKSGKSTILTFRNIFKKPETFQFQVSNQAFELNSYKETIQSQKHHEISVSYIGQGTESCETGKLVCQVIPNDTPELQWIYYLKGKRD